MYRIPFWIRVLTSLALASQALHADDAVSKLKLVDAINQGLANNLSLKIERISPLIEEEGLIEEQAAFDPTLFGNASWRESEQAWIDAEGAERQTTSESRAYNAGVTKKLSTGADLTASVNNSRSTGSSFSSDLNQVVGGDRNDEASFSLSITQPLLQNFGSRVNRASIRQAESRQQEAMYRLQNETTDLLETIEIAYWQLADSYERRSLSQSNIELAEDQLSESEARQRAGMATKIEILQAEANLARRKQEIIQAEEAISNAADTLMASIGALGENVAIDNRPMVQKLSQPNTQIAPFEKVLASTFENNFDTAIQNEILRQLEQNLILARNSNRPELDLTLASSYNGLSSIDSQDAFEQALDRKGDDWNLRLGFSLPWGKRASKANVRQTEYTIDQAHLRLAEIKQDLIQTIRSSWRSLQTSQDQLQAAKVVVELQQATYDQEKGKYDEGLSSLRDVLETQRDLDAAILDFLDAQLSTVTAEIRLARVQGTLLERHKLNWDELPASKN
ncbi:TolC family protein [Puniceicoccaceae bacterium K14]|nr:TolC family protein [Puniceicoccaceae bacterium K14]